LLAAKDSKIGRLTEQVFQHWWKLLKTNVQGERTTEKWNVIAQQSDLNAALSKVAKVCAIVSEEERMPRIESPK